MMYYKVFHNAQDDEANGNGAGTYLYGTIENHEGEGLHFQDRGIGKPRGHLAKGEPCSSVYRIFIDRTGVQM